MRDAMRVILTLLILVLGLSFGTVSAHESVVAETQAAMDCPDCPQMAEDHCRLGCVLSAAMLPIPLADAMQIKQVLPENQIISSLQGRTIPPILGPPKILS